MTEILIATWSAIISVLSSSWSLVETVFVWAGSVLYHLHTDAPRLEGLLIGVFLTWVLLRRDNHPLLRVVSAPLKLIIDILDLAWDQVAEVVRDVADTARSWILKTWDVVTRPVVKLWKKALSFLASVKLKLSKRKDESKE